MADIIIVGCGPAGIFAARELLQHQPDLKITMVDQGKSIHRRARTGADMLEGWGGAGAFSDGKLTISSDVGGQLVRFLPETALHELMEYVDAIYASYRASGDVFRINPDIAADISARARLAGLRYLPSKVRHIGTENCLTILKAMEDELFPKVDLRFGVPAETLLTEAGRISGVKLADGTTIEAPRVVVAPGRVGSRWMADQAKALGLDTRPNPVDLGVRVELPAVVFEELTSKAYETKFIYYSKTFDDPVRTFCMNPYGEVVQETVGDLLTVNGHSWANKRTENTNFALLTSADFTDPFDDPIGYGRSVAELANMLGKGVIVQRLGDLLAGRRTTAARLERCLTRPTLKSATPGDLSYCLPYRLLTNIVEMLEGLDRIAPGTNADHTLLYGIEVKFYSHRITLDNSLQSQIPGLSVIGDGAGVTRGLMQASCSGIIAARAILDIKE